MMCDLGFVVPEEKMDEVRLLSRQIIMALIGMDPSGDCNQEAIDQRWEKISKRFPGAPCHQIDLREDTDVT